MVLSRSLYRPIIGLIVTMDVRAINPRHASPRTPHRLGHNGVSVVRREAADSHKTKTSHPPVCPGSFQDVKQI